MWHQISPAWLIGDNSAPPSNYLASENRDADWLDENRKLITQIQRGKDTLSYANFSYRVQNY